MVRETFSLPCLRNVSREEIRSSRIAKGKKSGVHVEEKVLTKGYVSSEVVGLGKIGIEEIPPEVLILFLACELAGASRGRHDYYMLLLWRVGVRVTLHSQVSAQVSALATHIAWPLMNPRPDPS